MTATFHLLWMVCALGAIVFAAVSACQLRQIGALAVGFASAAAWSSATQPPEPGWVGIFTAAAVGTSLFAPRSALAVVAWGGALGGLWTGLLELQGLSAWTATGIATGTLALTIVLTRTRAVFAPDVMLDEALLAVGALGVAVAILPGILDGWRAAANLNSGASTSHIAAPLWTTGLVIAFAAMGALHSLWSHRR